MARSIKAPGFMFPTKAPEGFHDRPGHSGKGLAPMPNFDFPDHSQVVKDGAWSGHRESTGSRRPPSKGTFSFRGSTVDNCGREIVFESTLERDLADILLADRRVVDLQDQPPPMRYRDAEGHIRQTTMDFMVTMADGRKVAIAVKPEAKRKSSDIDDVVRRVRQANASVADSFVVRSEIHIGEDQVHNARLIRQYRKLRIKEDVEALAGIVATTRGAMQLSSLIAAFEPPSRGYIAAVNLIDDGRLQQVAKGRISHSCLVCNANIGQ